MRLRIFRRRALNFEEIRDAHRPSKLARALNAHAFQAKKFGTRIARQSAITRACLKLKRLRRSSVRKHLVCFWYKPTSLPFAPYFNLCPCYTILSHIIRAARTCASSCWFKKDGRKTICILLVKPVRRACARGSKFGRDASLTHVASRRARAVRAKYSLAGLTSILLVNPVRRACCAARHASRQQGLTTLGNMCTRLEIRTGRLAYIRSVPLGARSASEMQACWHDNFNWHDNCQTRRCQTLICNLERIVGGCTRRTRLVSRCDQNMFRLGAPMLWSPFPRARKKKGTITWAHAFGKTPRGPRCAQQARLYAARTLPRF